MKSYIQAIVLFNKNGEKRVVALEPGVNIITGESKTGKSALVEIIDYCLCSTRCTVPKGKITNFTHLYVLVMYIKDHKIVIARQSWNNGGKMYISRENADFDAKAIELNYFEEKYFRSCKEVQYEIESELHLLVSNMVTDEDQNEKKASLRNMTSYMFQHQNLMASKFALFYRFTDYYKRKDVIDQFPIFAGMIGQEYYSALIELNNLKTQLRRKEKQQKANARSTAYIKKNLQPLLHDYYALLNMQLDETLTAQKMLKLSKELPGFDDSQFFGEKEIVVRYNRLNTELESLLDKERDIRLRIERISSSSETGESFAAMLDQLKQQTDSAPVEGSLYTCPLCGHECAEITEDDNELVEATKWLDNELQITEKYTMDFSEDVRKLNEGLRIIEGEIKDTLQQIKILEKKFMTSKELVSKREKANYAKARIMLYAEMSDTGVFETVDEDIEILKNDIVRLEEKLAGYDLPTQLSKAQTFLSENMNQLSHTLDFEKEYNPINLNFGLVDQTFDLYHHQNGKDKIYLYEMGSGANWVSCHIALFLSFLRLFSSNEKSPMPLFLFFDQPSQVYFPRGDEKTNELPHTDIVAVGKMYKTIFDEVHGIERDTGVLPQILIVDHVDGHALEIKDEFLQYTRYNWVDGRALI
ncbi:DUF3732 domain-containing protein [Flintibacter sp. P01028]|uniref:DUF3732 domain-containing protein n=1 Tax=Flintibacter sp. P01028 TaxID=3342382 RepID=UPI0035B5BE7F